jgi:syntaxin 16
MRSTSAACITQVHQQGFTTVSRATAKLLGAALDGASDLEHGTASISATFAPAWVQKSEKIKGDMGILRERLNKLKE